MRALIYIFFIMNLGCYGQKEINKVDEFGLKQGKWIEFENVPKKIRTTYVDGVDTANLPTHESHYVILEYENNLKYKSIGNYRNDLKVGIWEIYIGYDKEWRLVKKYWYQEEGAVMRFEQYYKNGNIKFLRKKRDSIFVLIQYDENGKVIQKTNLLSK